MRHLPLCKIGNVEEQTVHDTVLTHAVQFDGQGTQFYELFLNVLLGHYAKQEDWYRTKPDLQKVHFKS